MIEPQITVLLEDEPVLSYCLEPRRKKILEKIGLGESLTLVESFKPYRFGKNNKKKLVLLWGRPGRKHVGSHRREDYWESGVFVHPSLENADVATVRDRYIKETENRYLFLREFPLYAHLISCDDGEMLPSNMRRLKDVEFG